MSVVTVDISPLDSLAPAADLTGKVGYFMARDSNDKAAVATTPGIVAGVLMNEPNAQMSSPSTQFQATLLKRGKMALVSGAAVTKGTFITNDTAGKCIAAVEADVIHGVALETVSAANKSVLCEISINSGTYLVADNT